MQQCVNHFSSACDNFGFTISTKKTEVMHQPAPRKIYHEPHIFVNDEPLKATDSFTYLGSTLSREANIDVEVNNRLSKANSAFGRLRKKVWDRRGISQETKLKVYMAVVLTVLLYACESWTVYILHARKLNHFHTQCLRIILSIKWQDMVPNTEVLTRAGIPSIHRILQKAQVVILDMQEMLCHIVWPYRGNAPMLFENIKQRLSSYPVNMATHLVKRRSWYLTGMMTSQPRTTRGYDVVVRVLQTTI